MDILRAVIMVVDFIVENELYSFKSLSDETQKKLIDTYGADLEFHVDKLLGLI